MLRRSVPTLLRALETRRVFWVVDGVCRVRDGSHLLVNPEFVKRRGAVQHLVQDATERPDITWSTNFESAHSFLKFDSFRAHVIDGPNVAFAVDIGGIVCDGIGDSKVDEFELTTNDDEIRRLQVGMDDFLFMDDMNSLEHL